MSREVIVGVLITLISELILIIIRLVIEILTGD